MGSSVVTAISLKERVIIQIDYKSLKKIINLTDSVRRPAGWCLRLAEFELDAIRCTGVRHQAADAVFRLPTKGEDRTTLDDNLLILVIESPGNSSFDLIKLDATRTNYILYETTQYFSDNAASGKNKIFAKRVTGSDRRAAISNTGTLQF